MSWSNPLHPGYPYPEISGLLLSLTAQLPGSGDQRRRLSAALVAEPGAPQGAGRHGLSYAFDTAMAVRGLLRGGTGPESERTAMQWGSLLLRWVADRHPCPGQPDLAPETHWSLSFGAHQSKIAGALVDLRGRVSAGVCADFAVDDLDEALGTLAHHTLGLQGMDGRFRTHERSDITYLHAHCYAVEGLLMQPEGRRHWSSQLEGAANWLAEIQQEDGSFLAWHDGRHAFGPARADATAQAIRIFRLVDHIRFADAIEAGGRSLGLMQSSEGGLFYEVGSADIAVWPTIFAAQAVAEDGDPLAVRTGADLV